MNETSLLEIIGFANEAVKQIEQNSEKYQAQLKEARDKYEAQLEDARERQENFSCYTRRLKRTKKGAFLQEHGQLYLPLLSLLKETMNQKLLVY